MRDTLKLYLVNTRLRRDGKVFDRKTGQVRSCVSYCITSVVTPLAHRSKLTCSVIAIDRLSPSSPIYTDRCVCANIVSPEGHGYGNQMLSLLHYIFAPPSSLPPFPYHTYGAPPATTRGDALYTTLWSDVGDQFYKLCKIGRGEEERDGWVAVLDEECAMEVGAGGDGADGQAVLEEGKAIKDYQFKLPEGAVDMFEAELLKKESESAPSSDIFIMDSANSPGIVNYYLLRAPGGSSDSSDDASIAYGYHDTEKPSTWAVWYKVEDKTGKEPTTLHVTALALSDPPTEFKDLLNILQAQARITGCSRITAWGLTEEMKNLWKGAGGEVIRRKEHLGAMAWYGAREAGRVRLVCGGE